MRLLESNDVLQPPERLSDSNPLPGIRIKVVAQKNKAGIRMVPHGVPPKVPAVHVRDDNEFFILFLIHDGISLAGEDSPETQRQADVRKGDGLREKRSDLLVAETGDAAADARHQEGVLRMRRGELDEFIHVGPDGLHAPLHRRDGITLALLAHTLAPDGAETGLRKRCGAAGVMPLQVAAEDENLLGAQALDPLRRDPGRSRFLVEEVIDVGVVKGVVVHISIVFIIIYVVLS